MGLTALYIYNPKAMSHYHIIHLHHSNLLSTPKIKSFSFSFIKQWLTWLSLGGREPPRPPLAAEMLMAVAAEILPQRLPAPPLAHHQATVVAYQDWCESSRNTAKCCSQPAGSRRRCNAATIRWVIHSTSIPPAPVTLPMMIITNSMHSRRGS